MTARAGIVVTGTEVLSGIVADRNGPWLSERLRGRGVEVAHIVVCGDRPADLRAALEFLAGEGVALIVTSGGWPSSPAASCGSTRRSRSGSGPS
jgi:nicotinamide-nucleotide amidase